jgi:HK97 family phage portal protein
MGILDRVFALERRAWGNADDRWYMPVDHLQPSKAGVTVDDSTAMRCATVYACVRVLAESIASLPVHLYERRADGGRKRATDHWAYSLIHRRPHEQITSYQWFETAVFHLMLTGNHYSVIDWTNDSGVVRLTPLNPRLVEVERTETGSRRYKYREPSGKERFYSEANILQIPGLAWDGLQGLSPISYARETIGLAVAAEEFGERFFSNGTNMGHIFSLPEGVRMDTEQTDKFIEDLKATHAGLGKSHDGMVIPSGMSIEKVGIPPDDAQFLETRKFQKAEIASIYRIPLHLIQEHEKNTTWGSGIEHMNLGFVIYTLRPWLVRIEQMLNQKFLVGTDAERFYFEFLVDALLRGDQKSRSEYFATAIQNKWMVPNEVREKENMNPVEWGDEPVEPANIFGAGGDEPPQDPEEKTGCTCGHEHRAEPDPELDHPRMSIQRSYRRVIRDAMARVIRRERNDIMAFAKKAQRKRLTIGETRDAALAEFIAEFYTAHEEFTRAAIRPAFTALAEAIGAEAMREIGQEWQWNDELEAWLEEYVEAFASRHSNQSRGQLLELLDELEQQVTDVDEAVVLDGLGQRFEEWEIGLDGAKPRDDKIGARESVRLGNGFAAVVLFAAGVAALVWRATGSETCPYCQSLSGRTVSLGQWFVGAGEDFAPGGAEPLRPRSNVGHPPLHSGCDCLIVPG